ncbi:hypothetical protein B0H14DRAFT_3509145 [Mycena olivaceomarginata]|nr:hypothetical protein B0H14DRAFT_3509145 [Mycena olivaceomarginata]
MGDQAEGVFLRVYLNTLTSQPIVYKDDYQQPPENSLKKIPVLQDFTVSSSPLFAYATARPRTRFEQRFSAFAPPSSTSGSSNRHGGHLTLARPPQPAWRSFHVPLIDGRYNQGLPFASGLVRSPPEPPANPTSDPLPPKTPIPNPHRVKPTGGGASKTESPP